MNHGDSHQFAYDTLNATEAKLHEISLSPSRKLDTIVYQIRLKFVKLMHSPQTLFKYVRTLLDLHICPLAVEANIGTFQSTTVQA